jgi:hypothetical protein
MNTDPQSWYRDSLPSGTGIMIVEFPGRDGRPEDGVVEEGGLLVQLGDLVVGGGRLHQRRWEYLVLVMLVCRLPAKSIEDHFQGLTSNNMQRKIVQLSKMI